MKLEQWFDIRRLATLLVLAAGAAAQDTQPARIDADATENVAPGVTHRSLRFTLGGSPFSMHILEADPAHHAVNILPVRAQDRAIGKETVLSMAKRFGASAAINGGYFEVPGNYAGTSHGVYFLNGEILTSGAHRSALLLCRESGFREHAEVDVVDFKGTVTAPDGSTFPIASLNRPRKPGEIVLYTPMLGGTTRTTPPGIEVAIDAGGRVRAVERAGDSPIPPNGFVLSASGDGASWLEKHARAGTRLQLDSRLEPADPASRSCRAEDIVGAGPRLVRRGVVDVTDEHFGHAAARHPRSGWALTRRGTFLFVTVDGRQASSAGMTMKEFATELVALGAVEAINLDGGGSTTMVVGGTVRNSPSDGEERPVSDALLVFSVPDETALGGLIARLTPGQIQEALGAKLRKALAASGSPQTRLDAVARLARASSAGEMTPAAMRLILEACGSLAAHR